MHQADMSGCTITSKSKPSLAPFSEINMYPESSLCIDFGKMLVPEFPTKKSCFDVASFIERLESHLFVTWRLSYSKMYLVRFSVVNQSNSFAMIFCSVLVFMYILVVLYTGFNLIIDLGVISKAFSHHLQAR